MTHLMRNFTQAADAGLELASITIGVVRDTALDIAEDAQTARERTMEVARIAGNEAYAWTLRGLADAKAARLYQDECDFGYVPDTFDAMVRARIVQKRKEAAKK